MCHPDFVLLLWSWSTGISLTDEEQLLLCYYTWWDSILDEGFKEGEYPTVVRLKSPPFCRAKDVAENRRGQRHLIIL